MKFRASDGASIAYQIDGDGPALLCLSGLSRNSSDFDYLRPHISGFRFITMDYRGRGDSDWTGAATYTIPRESLDAIELLDHLGIEKTAILGTSRGGLIAMGLAGIHKNRLSGIILNDIGPELGTPGLQTIRDYIGKNPVQKTYEDAAAQRANLFPGFDNVPPERWISEVRKHYLPTEGGLKINYDPDLARSVRAAFDAPPINLWPYFDAMEGLRLAALRGENSTLLSKECFDQMQERRPDMIAAQVPDRGHVPFLDEPESLPVIHEFLKEIK